MTLSHVGRYAYTEIRKGLWQDNLANCFVGASIRPNSA